MSIKLSYSFVYAIKHTCRPKYVRLQRPTYTLKQQYKAQQFTPNTFIHIKQHRYTTKKTHIYPHYHIISTLTQYASTIQPKMRRDRAEWPNKSGVYDSMVHNFSHNCLSPC